MEEGEGNKFRADSFEFRIRAFITEPHAVRWAGK